ncbi:MAG: hypothetical protein R6U50_05815 [Desulfobacterales bacterium]
MLTKGDDYPIHQLPEPIATAGSDRNFYDRYFFNGYSLDDHAFLALALGVYPHLNIMDSSFTVISDGIQHNLRTSRHLGMERMDTTVGPITVKVLEPLKKLQIIIDENDYGIHADLTFTARAKALEEPRYTYRIGPRVIMDSTRMTQNGCYSGWIRIKDKQLDVSPEKWFGTRDRSWGVRPVGVQDPQPPAPAVLPQFYWLWAPVNFENCVTLFSVNEDADGHAWHSNGLIAPLGDAPPEFMDRVDARVRFKSGTRHAESAEITFLTPRDETIVTTVKPLFHFYMSGIGYGHPEWGHGMNKGELATAYDFLELSAVDESDPINLHIQAVSEFQMGEKTGRGVLEQLIIGPHAPSGFKDILDMAS